MIELETSNKNALELYWLLNEKQRNYVRVNGVLLSKIKGKGLNLYRNNCCGWTSLFFEESMFKTIKSGERWVVKNEENKDLGYIQNVPNPKPEYYVYLRKTLLSVLTNWKDVEEFVDSLCPETWDNIRISHAKEKYGVNWLGLINGFQYLFEYDDGKVEYENKPIYFRSDKDWNEVRILDVKNNLKEIAKLKREINEYVNL